MKKHEHNNVSLTEKYSVYTDIHNTWILGITSKHVDLTKRKLECTQ